MSLRVRLLAVVAATFAIVVIGSVYAAHLSTSHELRAETDRFLLQRARDPGLRAFAGGGPRRDFGPRDRQGLPPFAEPDALVQVIGRDGSVALSSDPGLPIDDHDRAIAQQQGATRFRDINVNGRQYRMLTASLGDDGAVQIARDITDTNDVISTLDVRLVLIALIGTGIAALLAWVIARRIVRPVEDLTRAAERVAATQDLTYTIDVDRNDEIGRLATSFNTMLVALRTSRDQQRRLIMDASHELRTPLTAMRTNIDVLRRNTDLSDAERGQLVDDVERELSELSDLFAELVDLATDTRAEEPVQTVSLDAVVAPVVERFRRRTGRSIDFDVHEPATLDVRVSALERAVSNLVDNACKFSPPDAPVEVRVAGTSIDVCDHGPGISAEDRAHVFDRFYRSVDARGLPGSGLGLSIVRQIVDLHHGTIDLRPREGGGTIARINLSP